MSERTTKPSLLSLEEVAALEKVIKDAIKAAFREFSEDISKDSQMIKGDTNLSVTPSKNRPSGDVGRTGHKFIRGNFQKLGDVSDQDLPLPCRFMSAAERPRPPSVFDDPRVFGGRSFCFLKREPSWNLHT